MLKSNLIVTVPAGAAIHGAAKGGGHYLVADPNPYDGYQDYGHSHWKDSLFYGKGLDNVTLKGGGSISGNGALADREPVKSPPARLQQPRALRNPTAVRSGAGGACAVLLGDGLVWLVIVCFCFWGFLLGIC